jgi:hypothetical protein
LNGYRLAKRKRKQATKAAAPKSAAASSKESTSAVDDQIQSSVLSLHELFAQQARTMLERSDLNEEQKQTILVAMSCPCCGAGAPSFTVKLKRRS